MLVAGFQSAGRGRRARDWVAPPGSGLLFTAILPRRVAARALWAVPFWTALCVAAGIESATAVRAGPVAQRSAARRCQVRRHPMLLAGDRRGRRRSACGVGLNVRRPDSLGELAARRPRAPAFLWATSHPSGTRDGARGGVCGPSRRGLALAGRSATARGSGKRGLLSREPPTRCAATAARRASKGRPLPSARTAVSSPTSTGRPNSSRWRRPGWYGKGGASRPACAARAARRRRRSARTCCRCRRWSWRSASRSAH